MYRKERNEKIRELRRSGETLRAIGDRFGIGRERVRQLCDGIPVPERRRTWHEYQCELCGKTRRVRGRQRGIARRFCSRQCSGAAGRGGPNSKYEYVVLECSGCGKWFKRSRYLESIHEYCHQKRGHRGTRNVYCSQECYHLARRGKPKRTAGG